MLAALLIIKKEVLKMGYFLDIYFGVPGSGKTTLAAWLARKCMKKNKRVVSNVPITGTEILDAHKDIGTYQIENALVLIDEASVDYNNRNYKNMSQNEIAFFKYFRHYKCNIAVFSQSYDDMDITLRRLASRFFVVKKSMIPFFVTFKQIGRKIGIDEHTKQIIDEYSFIPFSTKWVYCPPLWKMFNTYSHKKLPEKEFKKW